MSITGLPGQGPVRVGIPIADLTAGLFCALGIMVALLEREQSGAGQWIQTSLLQAQIFMLDFQAARWFDQARGAGTGRQQSSDQHPDRRVQDRRTATSTSPAAGQKDPGSASASAVERKKWLNESPDYATAALRTQHRNALNAEIDKISVGAHQRRLGRASSIDLGVPCGPIYSDRPGVRRSAGRAPWDRAKRRQAERRDADRGRPAGHGDLAHAEPDLAAPPPEDRPAYRKRGSRGIRLSYLPARSPRCARPMRFEIDPT